MRRRLGHCRWQDVAVVDDDDNDYDEDLFDAVGDEDGCEGAWDIDDESRRYALTPVTSRTFGVVDDENAED